MATINLGRDILNLITQSTPEHAAQVLQTAMALAGAQVSSSVIVSAPQKVTKAGTKSRNKKTKRDNEAGGPKRPLNSWMAFRKFYSASLAPHTQKAISKILMTWWRDDPFAAKWTILAKAYSIVRGTREKDQAPLDKYFEIAAPVIGVIAPDRYQSMMGWQLTPSTDGSQIPEVTRSFVPDLKTFNNIYTTTKFSVEDLVSYCMTSGYCNSTGTSQSIPANMSAQGALTMAVQPTTTTMPTTTVTGMPQANVVAPNTTMIGPTNAEQTATIMATPQFQKPELEVVSPTAVYFHQMGISLSHELGKPAEPIGQTALNKAVVGVVRESKYPHLKLSDPTSKFDISFNPAEEDTAVADGGEWDAYDFANNGDTTLHDNGADFNFSQFVDDGMF